MEFTVENICGLLIRGRLMAPEEMKAMHQRWQAEAKDAAGQLAHFRKWLVANQYVTDYQAALLFKGHADDFFLNQYKIVDRLGKGRMAGVYKAVHQLGQLVAIKVLPPSKAKDAQHLGRFQREARLAVRLKHPNVVRTFQVGQANGLNYLVMEYLEGETLDDVLQRRKSLPPGEAVRLIHQALLGLQHIHEQGVVHRDMKPANLMLVPGPKGNSDTTFGATVKILDIGLGRVLFDESAPKAQQNLELTGEGVLLGTPDYLAPEQARDPRTIDVRADIYSLGCVLYHALTGQPPFPDKNILNQMVRHATETPTPLRELNPAVPDGLQQIMNWMLAKQPEQRYPTPERAAQALQMFLVAESEPERAAAEEGPQMRKFLTWLETGDGGETVTIPVAAPVPPKQAGKPPSGPSVPGMPGMPGKPPSGPALPAKPASAPALPVAQAVPSKTTPPPPVQPTARVKRQRNAAAGVLPAAEPVELDVELVPLDTDGPRQRARLSRRDWLMMGIGAGAVIVAGVIGMVLALVLRSE